MTDAIVSERLGAVLRLTMNRPGKKNALNDAMYAALAAGLAEADGSDAIGAVLITGAGDTFTAGNDIADFAAVAAGDVAQADRSVHRFLERVATFTKPLIAAVPGLAVGIGTTMLLHCDYVMLAEGARLAAPFVGLGLVPEAGSSLLLPARIGHSHAFAMFVLGEAMDAPNALARGLANRVVPGDVLPAEALAVATKIAAQPRAATGMTKRLLRDAVSLEAAMAAERECFQACLQSEEARAAFAAFAARKGGL